MTENEENTKMDEETYSEYAQIDPSKSGSFIKNLRISHNLTQENLAEKLFVSRKAVSKWENGLSSPSIDILKNLSVYFSVSIDEIIDGQFEVKKVEVVPDYKITMNTFKHNKKFSFISALLIFSIFNLSIFYMDNKEGTELYSLNGFSEEFFLKNGTITTLNNQVYINFGTLYIDTLSKYYNSNCELKIYKQTKNKNKIDLMNINFPLQPVISLSSLNNFFPKNKILEQDLYFETTTEYNNQNIIVPIEKVLVYSGSKSYSGEKASEYYDSNMAASSRSSLIDNSVYNKQAEDKEVLKTLDVSFLFEQDEEFYEKLDGKTITIDKEKYKIEDSDKKGILIKSSNKKYIYFDLDKNILYLSDNLNHLKMFNIINGQILFDDTNNQYFNYIKKIVNFIKK